MSDKNITKSCMIVRKKAGERKRTEREITLPTSLDGRGKHTKVSERF